MAHTSEDLVGKLSEIFRTHGYEGATLAAISRATGLSKSSLYHHYPNGKEQMAEAVMDSTGAHLREHVLAPLAGGGNPRKKVAAMAKRLATFYGDGTLPCLLDTLSIGSRFGDTSSAIPNRLRQAFQAIHAAFATVSSESGKSKATAHKAATSALVEIEGALVVARVSGDTKPFRQAIKNLPGQLCD